MFGIAQGHRLSDTRWYYKGRPIEFADHSAIVKRLDDIDSEQRIQFGSYASIQQGESLYVMIKRAISSRGAPEYIRYVLRIHRGRKTWDVAYGNGLVKLTCGAVGTGFVTLITPAMAIKTKCSFANDNSVMEGGSDSMKVRWLRREAANPRECSTGEVILEANRATIELRLTFPSRRSEDSGRSPGIQIHQDGELLGEARRFAVMFGSGFRVGLWAKDEVPVFRAAKILACGQVSWSGLVAACVGVLYCYSPIQGFRG